MNTNDDLPYRSKVIETEIQTQQPQHAMPAKQSVPAITSSSRPFSLKWVLLLSGFASVIGFGIVDLVTFVSQNFAESPITTSMLGSFVGVFILSVISLIGGEFRGYKQVSNFVESTPSNEALDKLTQKDELLSQLAFKHKGLANHSYASQCYQRFTGLVKADHSVAETRDLYHQYVTAAVNKQANDVVKKEALASGSLAFISPNHLIQSVLILWVSLRTIRRVAQVYGLRPATAGNIRLMKLLAQQLAAQSIFDLATDEMTNQLSGSLAAKLVENTAEAVAAGALNVRLGKTLIKMLEV